MSRKSPATGRYVAGAVSSPSATRPTRRVFSNHRGSERWTSNTSDSISSSTGAAYHFNSNRQIGCTVACASVPPNVNSHEIRASDCCLQATASSPTKTGHVTSAAPSFPSAPNSGTRLEIFTGASAKSPLTTTSATYLVRFLDDPGPVKINLSPSRYTGRDSWCLQTHQGSTLQHGILRNVDESRGVELADPATTN